MQLSEQLRRLRFGFARRLPIIIQTEQTECGLACLAMIASWHGHQIDLPLMRQRFGLSLRGATLTGLMDIAAQLNLSCRPLRLDLDDLANLQTPCLLHWDMNHFVVLKKVLRGERGIVVHDPARGEVRISQTEVSRLFTGVALELMPTASFERKRASPKVSLGELLGRAVGLKRSLAQILILTLALEIFSLVSPFFMQWVVDGAILSSDSDLLTLLILGFALLMVVQTAVGLARSWVVMYMSTHLSLQWTNNIFSHLLRLPMAYFEKRSLGDVLSRFGSIGSIQRTLTTNFIEAIIDGLLTVATLAMMLFYSIKLSAVVLASVLLYAVLRTVAYLPFRLANEQQIVLQAREQNLFLESIRGLQSIKLFNNEEQRRTRWLNSSIDTTNRSIATQTMGLGFGTAHSLLAGIENLLIVWLGAKLVLGNTFSVGMLFAFISYKSTFAGRVYALIDKGVDLKMLSLQSERLSDIVLTSREDEAPRSRTESDPDHIGPAPNGALHATGNVARILARSSRSSDLTGDRIEVRELSFRHSASDAWVLRGVNLTIHSGESVAIVGPSGSGKTTLVKLLLGLLKPTEGEICIDGISLSDLRPESYRSIIGAVMQDDQLFTGSIRENIAFFGTHIDDAWLVECAQMARIDSEIDAMSMRYESQIGDMGVGVSGGQKQRILLARALYKRPKILVLDEATSHLDVTAESAISAAIRELSLTRILVAHRRETIETAKRVFDLGASIPLREQRRALATLR
jgi:ATP-binding cassette subfamily B protein RaxB